MLETIQFSFNAVAPILLLTALGYLFTRIGLFNQEFLKVANKFVFRVGLPTMLFCNVYEIESLSAIRWGFVLLATLTVVLLFFIALVLVRFLVPDHKQKGVIMQCTFRSNFAVIGLPLATSMGGAAGTAAASLLAAFTIPVFNVLAVISLSLYSGSERPSVKKILRDIAHNPMILGVLIGLVLLVIRALLPTDAAGAPVFTISGDLPWLYTVCKRISNLASPLAMLVLGGQFSFDAIHGLRRQLTLGVLCRTVMAPIVGLAIALLCRAIGLLQLSAGEIAGLAALYGSPVAVSSAIMAGQMGNDEQLAGQLVVWTSIVSLLTLFLIIFTLRQLGLL